MSAVSNEGIDQKKIRERNFSDQCSSQEKHTNILNVSLKQNRAYETIT